MANEVASCWRAGDGCEGRLREGRWLKDDSESQ